MRLLLDTHILIWYLNGDNLLSKKNRDFIEDVHSKLFISMASLWEIAIKVNIKKLDYYAQFDAIPANLRKYGIEVLDINYNHLKLYKDSPRHHGDPFDRMLIAQAISEDLTIITEDQNFKLYEAKIL